MCPTLLCVSYPAYPISCIPLYVGMAYSVCVLLTCIPSHVPHLGYMSPMCPTSCIPLHVWLTPCVFVLYVCSIPCVPLCIYVTYVSPISCIPFRVFHSMYDSLRKCVSPIYITSRVSFLVYPTPCMTHSVYVCPLYVSHPVSHSVCMSPVCIFSFRVSHFVYLTLCVAHSVCDSLRVCATPRVSHSVCVPLRMYPTPCISHYMCIRLCVSHSVYVPLTVSFNP